MYQGRAIYLEIDHRTIKLLVGIISISLAPLTSYLTARKSTSISESYWYGGLTQGVFIGFLFAIAAFMFAYNGFSLREMVLSKVAAIAAIGIALFPCECGNKVELIRCDSGLHAEFVPIVHYVSAVVMFLILAYFCRLFRLRALGKKNIQAGRRALVYRICGVVILSAIIILGLNFVSGYKLSGEPMGLTRLTYYGEAIALYAFGISWLVASRVFPYFTCETELYRILSGKNPPPE